jgi:anti-sigma factor RsiW
MNCAESRLLLHAHADDELDVAHSLELERHLKTCSDCAAENKSLRSLKAALREPSLLHRAPASLRRDVERMTDTPRAETQPRFNVLLLWKFLAFGAAAVALLTIILRPGGISEHGELLNEAVSSHVRSLMVQHLTDVASSDQHTVKPWFDGKLDFAPQGVKDFAAQGFPLVGGRLDYLRGRAVAALVYQRNKHFINVFVWPETMAASAKEEIDNLRGYSIVNRQAGGFHYCLVSDLNEKELLELAKLFGP